MANYYQNINQFNAVPTPTPRPPAPTDTGIPGSNLTSATKLLPEGTTAGITNQIGTSLGLGTGPGAIAAKTTSAGVPIPVTKAAATPGTLGSTTSLGAIGTAATVGSLAGGPIAGLVGGNETGGSIGGAIGGAAGSFTAGTATGTAVGAALGVGSQALNFVLPGLGIVVGGLAGSLFGPSDPNITSEFTSTISSQGNLTDIGVGTKHIGEEPAKYVASSVDGYFSDIQKLTGISFEGQMIRGGLGGGGKGTGFINVTKSGATGLDPYRDTTDDVQRFEFDIEDPEAMLKAMQDAAVYMAGHYGADEKTLDQIRNYGQTKNANPNVIPRDEAGVPLVGTRRATGKQTFAQFAEEYKRKQNAG